jgi:hypothetical protein
MQGRIIHGAVSVLAMVGTAAVVSTTASSSQPYT